MDKEVKIALGLIGVCVLGLVFVFWHIYASNLALCQEYFPRVKAQDCAWSDKIHIVNEEEAK